MKLLTLFLFLILTNTIFTQDHTKLYKIVSKVSSLVLEEKPLNATDYDPEIRLWDYQGRDNQKWMIIEVFRDKYRIVNYKSRRTLSAKNDKVNENGCPLDLTDYYVSDNQHWEFEETNINSNYPIKPVKIINSASGKVIDAWLEYVHNNGCGVQLWNFAHPIQGNQLWRLIPIEN